VATNTTVAILTALRNFLLNWSSPEDGKKLSNILDVRLYQVRAPDNTVFPYGTLRLSTRNDGGNNGIRLDGSLEIQLYGRPFTMQPDVYRAADLCDQAMLASRESGAGFVITRTSQRDALPVGTTPVDSEVVGVRLVYSLIIWPTFLTSVPKH
jgi:hypothetical protein